MTSIAPRPPLLAIVTLSILQGFITSGVAQSATSATAQGGLAATKRAALHEVLDQAKDEHSEFHDACLKLRDVGDASSLPHLIRVLQFFGDAELPLPPGVGIICTQQHCVDTLEKLTGVKVGISYLSWKRWWETTHPGETLAGPPNQRSQATAGALARDLVGSASARRT